MEVFTLSYRPGSFKIRVGGSAACQQMVRPVAGLFNILMDREAGMCIQSVLLWLPVGKLLAPASSRKDSICMSRSIHYNQPFIKSSDSYPYNFIFYFSFTVIISSLFIFGYLIYKNTPYGWASFYENLANNFPPHTIQAIRFHAIADAYRHGKTTYYFTTTRNPVTPPDTSFQLKTTP